MKSNSHRIHSKIVDPIDLAAPGGGRERLRLGMMHYHLRPGGVTSVMRDIAIALSAHAGYDSLETDVFASVSSETRARRTFKEFGRTNAENLRIVHVPGLAYRKEPYPDRETFIRTAEGIAEEILAHSDVGRSGPESPYILHSHNLSLGKNAAATMALRMISEKAARRALPLWLINHVHDFAENGRPEQMRAFFNCTGRRDETFARSFMYPNAPNVIYLTINSGDVENLLKIGIPRDRIFLLPDPIDSRSHAEGPLWEMAAPELAEMGLRPADFKTLMLQRLADYATSKKQFFDPSLPALLSPMKVMRRKNNIESLLLLMLFKHLGCTYQLMITLDANSPPDIAYSRRLKDFAAARNMPVVIGFGHELISETGKRRARNGFPTRFNLCDLYALCSGVLTTSIVEGFGLAYHEGWLCGKPVIGRRIPDVVRDFETNGMNFNHAYEKLAVSLNDLPDLRQRLLSEYEKKLGASGSPKRFPAMLTRPTSGDIIDAKTFRAGGQDCVDFADLSLEMQLELLDGLADSSTLRGRVIDRNPAVTSTFQILQSPDSGHVKSLIETNREVVRTKYSLEATSARLTNISIMGDSIFREKCEHIPLTTENHAAVIRRYQQPENLRLVF